jgi:pyrroline-5-carboxylate reductase
MEKTKSPLTGTVAILGCGKIGETLLAGMLDAGIVDPKRVVATAAHRERCDFLAKKYGVHTTIHNREAVAKADTLIICVKPQVVRNLLEEIRAEVRARQLLISVAASVTTQQIAEWVKKPVPIVRAMPNTPCAVRAGMTVVSAGPAAGAEHLKAALDIFATIGRVMTLDEKHMDAVTALSASGPAYIYLVLESLAEGGVKVGLPRDVASELAAQTALGAAKLALETKEHPAKLKDAVTTPAGCTIDGLLELEAGGLRIALINAVVKATQRAKELVRG